MNPIPYRQVETSRFPLKSRFAATVQNICLENTRRNVIFLSKYFVIFYLHSLTNVKFVIFHVKVYILCVLLYNVTFINLLDYLLEKLKSKSIAIFKIITGIVHQLAFPGPMCRTVTTGKDWTVSCVLERDASEKDDLACGKNWLNHDVCNISYRLLYLFFFFLVIELHFISAYS